ncbi:DNA polymerase III subunit beta [Corallincola platygyrae]|uniref:Beta sliding clamp n=1 Tax=Corallincola platygyrae TaxID=1193278 RepID=A0ABW4XMU9_9GAMM
MKLSVNREQLLRPLQLVSGAVERRQTLPVLANVLINVDEQGIALTGTDLEVELVARFPAQLVTQPGSTTVPAKKFLDICKSLPEGADIELTEQGDRLVVRSGRSRFNLATLPAAEFPNIEAWTSICEVSLPQLSLKKLMDSTSFSMANQDVRYYLNGMLFDLDGTVLRSVATDGHRLALATVEANLSEGMPLQCIVPRKGVLELQRLIGTEDQTITLQIGENHLRATVDGFTFTCKLVDGKFPDYQRVLPRGGDKIVIADRATIRDALARAAILSNEKFRGVRFNIDPSELKITANNPEQEEAEEVVEIDYQDQSLEMGFNVSYLLDVLNVIGGEQIKITLADANSSALIEDAATDQAMYVVMPMRL